MFNRLFDFAARLLSTPLALTFATTLALIANASPARADGKTWCVGGLSFSGSSTSVDVHACTAEKKNRKLPSWHWHNDWFVKVKGETGCFTCWDMSDDTCNTEGVMKGLIEVISAKECQVLGPARLGKSKFFDPENKWSPMDAPIRIIPLEDEPVVRKPRGTPPPEIAQRQPPPPVVDPDPEEAIPDPPPQVAVVPPETGRQPPTIITPPVRPPARPSRTPITVQIGVRVSPGPYAVNDPVTATGFATTGGVSRAVNGGWFQWVGPTGQPILGPDQKPLRLVATPGPNGTVVATGAAPQAGALTLVYQPGGIEVKANEKLSARPPPGEVTIQIAQCRLRGVVLAPTQGELVATTAAVKLALRGRFETTSGTASTALGGATAIFSVDVAGKEQRIPARDVGGELVGEIELQPPDADTDEISVRLFGDGGGNDVCPGATTKAVLTKLGVGLEVKATAKTCYVGRPCALEAKFGLPRDPTTRTAAVTFATAPDLELAVAENGVASATLVAVSPGDPESLFTGTFKPVSAGVIEIETAARSKAQGREVKDLIKIVVREPIELRLPTELDLGVVRAGSGWPAGCTTLDFTKSRGVLEQQFTMRSTPPKDCNSQPAVSSGGLGQPLPAGLTIEMQYDTRIVTICVADVPRCAAENPEPVVLTITPVSPDFADQKVDIKLRWRVEGRNFFACHWWWIAAGVGGVLLLLIGYGFVKPYDFSSHDAIKMASDRGKLARAVGRRLRDLPGGRSGWYRNAATGLRDDGSTTSKLGHAAVVLEARKGDVLLRSRGGLQRVHPQSKKLEPVDTGKDGVFASKGVSYVVGDLHFTVD